MYDNTYHTLLADTTKRILAVMSGYPQTMQLRLDEYKSIEVDGGEILELMNREQSDIAHMLAALGTDDEVMRESGKRQIMLAVSELAAPHADLEARDAERRERTLADMEA